MRFRVWIRVTRRSSVELKEAIIAVTETVMDMMVINVVIIVVVGAGLGRIGALE